MARVLSRRTFLRGSGAAVALPLLDAMTPARAADAAKAPVRAAFLYFPNGVWQDAWIPKATGAEYVAPFSLEPLKGVRDSVTVLSGLDKKHSAGGDGHYAKTANFLTGLTVTKTTGKDVNVGGVSVDQYLAAKHAGQTPLPSLELGTDPVISGIDANVGYTRLYGSYISWRNATTPVAKEINPKFVFDRLFGTGPAAGNALDKSILDLTLEDAKSLRGKLGRDDQFKLDEYLDAVRAVEKRIAFAAEKPAPAKKSDTAPPAGLTVKPPKEPRDHVKLMLDLMVLAFRTDSTRVASFMFANDVSGRNFSFLDGVKGGHHDMSHHEKNAEKIEQYKRIVRWHVGQFAYFCEQLRAVKEGSGTLLDNSAVVFGSSIADGNGHVPNNLPILLGGKGGGAFAGGRHVASPKGTPLCNLYVSVLAACGRPVQTFGDATGPLKGV